MDIFYSPQLAYGRYATVPPVFLLFLKLVSAKQIGNHNGDTGRNNEERKCDR